MSLLKGIGNVIKGGLSFLGSGNPIMQGIGTGLNLLGAAKGLAAPGPKGQSYESLMGAFKAADEAGLHRLSVAGSPAGYSPAPMSGAEGLMAAGQALRAPSKKQDDLLDAQIEEARSRTFLNQANARRAMTGPQPGIGQGLTRVLEGIERGLRVLPRENEAFFRDVGRVDDPMKAITNPVDLSEIVGSMLWYGPQGAYKKFNEAMEEENAAGRALRTPPDIANPDPRQVYTKDSVFEWKWSPTYGWRRRRQK